MFRPHWFQVRASAALAAVSAGSAADRVDFAAVVVVV
jgi:hypothetical protein